MNARRINVIFGMLTAGFVLAAVVAVLAGWMLPVDASVPSISRRGGRQAVGGDAPASLPPLESFARIWTLPLRQKLTDPVAGPVPSAAPATSPVAPPPVTLVGTIGSSLAMLKSGESVTIVAVGESLEGVEVIAIRPSQVDVRYNGRAITLEKFPEPATRQ